MFAIYNLPSRGNSNKFIGLSSLYLEIKMAGKELKVPLQEVNKVYIEKRRKLAPLVLGGIITSLSLLSIFLYSSRLEIIALVALGLLLTYYGMFEYTVIWLEFSNQNEMIWLPTKVKLESVRPFIALLEFYLNKRQFPVLYASPVSHEDSRLVHYEDHPVKSTGTIIYQFGKARESTMTQVAVNPTLLDYPLNIEGQGKVIAESEYLVNAAALIESNSLNLT